MISVAIFAVSLVSALIFLVCQWPYLSDIVRTGPLPANPNTAQDKTKANTATSSELGWKARIQDKARQIAKSFARLHYETLRDMFFAKIAPVLTDLIYQQRKDLRVLREWTDSVIVNLENRLLDYMGENQRLRGIISALNIEVQQANATAHAFRQAKETADQERKEEVKNLEKIIEILEADIRRLRESIAESQAYIISIDEDSVHWRMRCRSAEGKVARMKSRIENGEATVPDNKTARTTTLTEALPSGG